jgi:hypothetical protein
MRRRPGLALAPVLALLVLLAAPGAARAGPIAPTLRVSGGEGAITNATAVANFTGAMDRLVALVAAAGGAILALVWSRVALSWFSNDISKKVQAKDRARDALIGTLVFMAAISGLAFALAQWVVSGT